MDKSTRGNTAIAVIGAVAGFILLLVAISLEWHGFGGGLAIGVGVGLIAVGMYLWGFTNGLRRTRRAGMWRPSGDVRR